MSAQIPRPGRTATVLALSVVVGLGLGGCDLRLESPAPTERTASAAEVLRQHTVTDALALEQTARAARATAAGTAAAVAPVLDDVVAFSATHASELGGAYTSGLRASASPTAVAPATAPPSTPADVLAVLTSSAADVLGTADSVQDGGMARLLASIGTSRAQLASRLATALGVPAPTITPRAAAASVGPSAVPSASAAATSTGSAPVGPAPSPTSGTGSGTGPTPGLSPADLDALTVVQDQAGYGLEVVAAKLEGAGRSRALTGARAHRAAAEAWAVQSGTAAIARDPRRAAYALPTGLQDASTATTFARTLEEAVARTDAAMAAAAAPGSRSLLVADLRTAADAVVAWGGANEALPGLPAPAPSATPGVSTSPAPTSR